MLVERVATGPMNGWVTLEKINSVTMQMRKVQRKEVGR
jgi:hypothetical protein